jgi:hypothetical protein
MNQTRREFVTVTSVASASIVMSHDVSSSLGYEHERCSKDGEKRCPYFSQPLLCNGSDPNGNYPCDK